MTTAPADELGACGLLALLDSVGYACSHGLGMGVRREGGGGGRGSICILGSPGLGWAWPARMHMQMTSPSLVFDHALGCADPSLD